MALRRLASEISGRFGSPSLQIASHELLTNFFSRSCSGGAFKFAKSHEYASLQDDVATVGISDFAQKELGDVVYVELPEIGSSVTQGEAFGVVESVKAASDVYSPVSGEVLDANSTLADDAALVNKDPESSGWMIKVKLSDPKEVENLIDQDDYSAYCESLSG